MDSAYAHCVRLLRENGDRLNQVVDFLLAHESMTGEQFAACMEGQPIGDASDTPMLDI